MCLVCVSLYIFKFLLACDSDISNRFVQILFYKRIVLRRTQKLLLFCGTRGILQNVQDALADSYQGEVVFFNNKYFLYFRHT